MKRKVISIFLKPLQNSYFLFWFCKKLLQKQPDDEDFFVDNEEEMDLKEEPYKVPISKEYLGKLQYQGKKDLPFKKDLPYKK